MFIKNRPFDGFTKLFGMLSDTKEERPKAGRSPQKDPFFLSGI
jgi:hypothetical protein